jgi:hypothetical protein
VVKSFVVCRMADRIARGTREPVQSIGGLGLVPKLARVPGQATY